MDKRRYSTNEERDLIKQMMNEDSPKKRLIILEGQQKRWLLNMKKSLVIII